ncbi:hypothetical protein ILUMI_27281 [Ignelater luminosus]|uniref:General transcription factor IIF subunit 2 n=1 Tax=Ignelater luminosus TaxID=2038154 RepID=A0A8K0C890_IGNLU|nr:hypothetical protein ILUMI_27281 [Ignelater luminosus]
MSTDDEHTEKDLDLIGAKRGVWLVKVPKYIANRWDKAPGDIEVGRVKILKTPGQGREVSLTLPPAILDLKDAGEENIPEKHRLSVSEITQPTGVFSQTIPDSTDSAIPGSSGLRMEGKIIQKLDCSPYADDNYMKLKSDSIRKAAMSARQTQHLNKIVQTYKPVSDHQHNIEHMERKKAEGKRTRDDKEAVLEVLFAAFEKHQYYNIKDLVKLTNQPIRYLKEILTEVCNYISRNPHKNMWALKPEYHHYKKQQAETEKDVSGTE